MGNFIDLTGKKFGKLSVLKRAGKQKREYIWECKCDCGNIATITGVSLRSGNTRSCGCLHISIANNPSKTHGKSNKSRLYIIWKGMRQRCNNPNNPNYPSYGGRGLSIIPDWDNFETFESWAFKNGYDENLSLDRIDNDGNYEPNNCRWATRKQQNRNKRSNNLITYNGVTKCVADWADETGINYQTLQGRIHEHNQVDLLKELTQSNTIGNGFKDE